MVVLNEIIKKFDKFGFAVTLKYDKDSIRHRSVFGGSIGIIVYLTLLYSALASLYKI